MSAREPAVLSAEAWDEFAGRYDPDQRYRIYRLCECDACAGTGKEGEARCERCRGEGRARELVATCPDPQTVGTTLVELGNEGEFEGCPIGILDLEGESGKKWIVRPWLPSTRNVSDAARLLGSQPKGGRKKGEAR